MSVYVRFEGVEIVEHFVFIPEMEIFLRGEGVMIAEGDFIHSFPFVGIVESMLMRGHVVVGVGDVGLFLDETMDDRGVII